MRWMDGWRWQGVVFMRDAEVDEVFLLWGVWYQKVVQVYKMETGIRKAT